MSIIVQRKETLYISNPDYDNNCKERGCIISLAWIPAILSTMRWTYCLYVYERRMVAWIDQPVVQVIFKRSHFLHPHIEFIPNLSIRYLI